MYTFTNRQDLELGSPPCLRKPAFCAWLLSSSTPFSVERHALLTATDLVCGPAFMQGVAIVGPDTEPSSFSSYSLSFSSFSLSITIAVVGLPRCRRKDAKPFIKLCVNTNVKLKVNKNANVNLKMNVNTNVNVTW